MALMDDTKRSAFGLGWEYARQGKHPEECPFSADSFSWEQFMNGFKAYKPKEDDPPPKKPRKKRTYKRKSQ